MFGIGLPELIIILILALVIFGPGKLPSVGSAIGKAIGEFKKASKDLTKSEAEAQPVKTEKTEAK